jgi:peptide deformylase
MVKDIVKVFNNEGIVTKNIQFLITPTLPVDFPLDNYSKIIIRDLKETADAIHCAGIAANQINYNKRIFIGEDSYHGSSEYKIYINPKIIEFSDDSILDPVYDERRLFEKYLALFQRNGLNSEACLSIPGFNMTFPRYDKIRVKYLNENGEEIIEKREGFLSKLFQHETDHLNGTIIADRAIAAMLGKKGNVIKDDLYESVQDEENIRPQYKIFQMLVNELTTYAKCPYYTKALVVPFANEYQHRCKSEKFNKKCDHLVDRFCYNLQRNYHNCGYFVRED